MAKQYFRQVPEIQYPNIEKGNENIIGEYVTLKNLFKRGKLREDILKNLQFFEKYKIIGDERPDQIALNYYDSESLDWIVLLTNNIIDVRSEWPLGNDAFQNYLLDKYLTEEEIYRGIHHYETVEIQNDSAYVVLKPGLRVQSNFTFTYYDEISERYVTPDNIIKAVSNYEYELELENNKRNIYLLKAQYLNVVFNDLDKFMPYKEGSEQYVSRTLKKTYDINLYN